MLIGRYIQLSLLTAGTWADRPPAFSTARQPGCTSDLVVTKIIFAARPSDDARLVVTVRPDVVLRSDVKHLYLQT